MYLSCSAFFMMFTPQKNYAIFTSTNSKNEPLCVSSAPQRLMAFSYIGLRVWGLVIFLIE